MIKKTIVNAANIYFWITVFLSTLVLLGLSLLIIHTSPTLYQGFLRLCGVNAATCQQIIQSINPTSLVSIVLLSWAALIFSWQIIRTQIFLYSTRDQTFPLPRNLATLISSLALTNKVVVITGSSIFCAGIFRRRIYIGRELLPYLTHKELEAVLVHESYHLHSHDPLKILLVNSSAKAFFFLPALSELKKAYLAQKEISADRLATEIVGRQFLSSALCKVIQQNSSPTSTIPSFTAGFASQTVRYSTSFSNIRIGLTILIVGLSWILVKSSFIPGGCQ